MGHNRLSQTGLGSTYSTFIYWMTLYVKLIIGLVHFIFALNLSGYRTINLKGPPYPLSTKVSINIITTVEVAINISLASSGEVI